MKTSLIGRVSTLLLSTFVASACGTPDQLGTAPTPFEVRSGVYLPLADGAEPLSIAPGEASEFSFSADEGQKLVFADVLTISEYNGWYHGMTFQASIDLYESNTPISGDRTSSFSLRYVGTEEGEEPAVGPHTGPKQMRVSAAVPEVSSVLRATIHSDPATGTFTVRIENVSQDGVTLYLQLDEFVEGGPVTAVLWGPKQVSQF